MVLGLCKMATSDRHVLISGRVQGVGYRMATQQQARQLGLRGWVRNLADGRVEARFVGEATIVEVMVTWCWQGPPAAQVEAIEIADSSNPEAIAADFVILPTRS